MDGCMLYRNVRCPHCGRVYGVGYSEAPHNIRLLHRICNTCLMPIEVVNPWHEKEPT